MEKRGLMEGIIYVAGFLIFLCLIVAVAEIIAACLLGWFLIQVFREFKAKKVIPFKDMTEVPTEPLNPHLGTEKTPEEEEFEEWLEELPPEERERFKE